MLSNKRLESIPLDMSGNTEVCVRHLPVNVPDVNVFISPSATEEKHSREDETYYLARLYVTATLTSMRPNCNMSNFKILATTQPLTFINLSFLLQC